MLNQYFDGIKFGMILQLAIGPLCLMVFNVAKNMGFQMGFVLVWAIALGDSIYITIAGLGASKLIEKSNVKNIFKWFGAIVLMLFGLNIILGAFNINLIPSLNVKPTSTNIFIQGLVLTLSSPLSIVFFGSVLTNKIIDDNLKKNELIIFSCGIITSTILFLTMVAILGTIVSSFMPDILSKILNVCVGVLIIYFGLKTLNKKN